MSEEFKAAQARIACLEGEIAKRDETIARLEPQLNRAIQANYDLREELAACRVAVENCEVFRARIAELEARIVWLECEAQVNAAPVSEAKAQDTVGEVVGWYRLDRPYEMTSYPSVCATWHRLGAPVAPLYAAPVQQVSVPAWMASSRAFADRLYMAGWRDHADAQHSGVAGMYDELLAAAPAAPAADAGLVDMYSHLQKVTPYRFKKIQDAAVTDGGDVLYFHKDRFDAALLDDMAAHRAQGVV